MLAQALDLDDVEHGKQFNIFRLSNAATASIHVACRGPNAGGRIIIDKMPCSASQPYTVTQHTRAHGS